jgi:hypothetical protein
MSFFRAGNNKNLTFVKFKALFCSGNVMKSAYYQFGGVFLLDV